MDNEELLARLEKIDSDPIGAGLARNWHRNPDGPEAADRIRRLLKEADDHAERASHWRNEASRYQARVEELGEGLRLIEWRGRVVIDESDGHNPSLVLYQRCTVPGCGRVRRQIL